MRGILILLASMMLALPAAADLVLRGTDDHTELRLLTTPCSSAAVMAATNPTRCTAASPAPPHTASTITDGDHDGGRAKAARVESGGREWAACWVSSFGSEYIVADHRGVGYMPQDWFAKR